MGCQKLSGTEIKNKVEQALSLLKECRVCPRQCGAGRLENSAGICRSGRRAAISSYGPHFGEEEPLVGKYGSGTIFFSNCSLNCVFCQNYDISHLGEGREVTPEKLGKIMLGLQKSGCHNINLVSPTHFVPQILEALIPAVEGGLSVPLVYNTGGYDSVELLRILEGVVDIYMPDIKFGDDTAGEKYLGVKDYFTTAQNAVKEMYRQVGNLTVDSEGVAYRGLLIRHLVLPQDLAASGHILKFVAEEISKDTSINIMDQYYPAHQAFRYEELSRRITAGEYKKVLSLARSYGLENLL